MNNLQTSWTHYYENTNVGFEEVLVHKIVYWQCYKVAKLNAYRFSLSALKLMQTYLSERKQRTKTNQALRSWEEILFRVP